MDKENLTVDQQDKQLVIQKIKKAIWRYRLLGTKIPGEYIPYLLRLEGCSLRFAKHYFLKEGIYGTTYDVGIQNRQYFAETWVMLDLQSVIAYTGKHKDYITLIELIKRKDLDVLMKVEQCAKDLYYYKVVHTWDISVLQEFVRVNDVELLKYALKKLGTFSGIEVATKQALTEKKIEIFKTLLLYIKNNSLSYNSIMDAVIKSEDIQIYTAFTCIFKFSDSAILRGLQSSKEDIKDFLLKFQLSSSSIRSLIRGENNTSILEKYVQLFPIAADDQILLIRYNYASVLKIYQKQWGLDPSVMSYLAGLQVFEKNYGTN